MFGRKSRELKMNYQQFESFAGYSSNYFLMISELIDNSVSSYIKNAKKSKETDSINGLVIDIDIDILNKIFEIKDNANGMSSNRLLTAVQPGEIDQKTKDTNLNNYGVGMKHSAFWMGKSFHIETFDGKESSKTVIDLIGKDLNDFVKIDVVDGEMKENGTKIKISNLRNINQLSKKKFEETVARPIGWKYHEYIEKGLIIKYKIISEPKSTMNSYKVISKFRPKAEKLNSWIERFDVDINKFMSKVQSSIKNEMILGIIDNSIKNNMELIGKYKLDIGNEEIEINFGALSYEHNKHYYKNTAGLSLTKVNGLALYQMGRAVYCGPNESTVPNAPTTFPIVKKFSGGTNTLRRLFGYANMDALKPDSNKREFKWTDDFTRSDLESKLKSWAGTDWNKLLNIMNDFEKSHSTAKPNKNKIISKAVNENNEKTISRIVKGSAKTISEKSGNISHELELKLNSGDIKKIKMIEVADGLFGKFIKTEKIKGKIVITMNVEHKLWNPLVGGAGSDFRKHMLYPLALVLGLSKISAEDEMFRTSLGIKNAVDMEELIEEAAKWTYE